MTNGQAGTEPVDGAVMSSDLVVWGGTPLRWLAVVWELTLATVALIMSSVVQPRRFEVFLCGFLAVLSVAAALANIAWSLTRVKVTSESVVVWNLARRAVVSRSGIREIAWARRRLSPAQLAARWQRWGESGHLVLGDGEQVPLDCTRSAPSVFKSLLPMPSFEVGRSRCARLARALAVRLDDDSALGPDRAAESFADP